MSTRETSQRIKENSRLSLSSLLLSSADELKLIHVVHQKLEPFQVSLALV